MQEIVELTKIDYAYVFISIFTMLIGIKAFISVFEWIMNEIGIETKWERQRKEEKELLLSTSQSLKDLQMKHENDILKSDMRDEEICDKLKSITDMIIDKDIDDWRWKILEFSSALSNGRTYNRESYDHILDIYAKYEKVLEDRGLTNGLVDESIKFVKERYREYLNRGL